MHENRHDCLTFSISALMSQMVMDGSGTPNVDAAAACALFIKRKAMSPERGHIHHRLSIVPMLSAGAVDDYLILQFRMSIQPTCASSHIQQLHARRVAALLLPHGRRDTRQPHKVVLPHPVQARAHEVVHEIVLRRHAVKHALDQLLLLIDRHITEPEMCGLLPCRPRRRWPFASTASTCTRLGVIRAPPVWAQCIRKLFTLAGCSPEQPGARWSWPQ